MAKSDSSELSGEMLSSEGVVAAAAAGVASDPTSLTTMTTTTTSGSEASGPAQRNSGDVARSSAEGSRPEMPAIQKGRGRDPAPVQVPVRGPRNASPLLLKDKVPK